MTKGTCVLRVPFVYSIVLILIDPYPQAHIQCMDNAKCKQSFVKSNKYCIVFH